MLLRQLSYAIRGTQSPLLGALGRNRPYEGHFLPLLVFYCIRMGSEGWDHGVATPALLCHKDTAQKHPKTSTMGISCLSLWHKSDSSRSQTSDLCYGEYLTLRQSDIITGKEVLPPETGVKVYQADTRWNNPYYHQSQFKGDLF